MILHQSRQELLSGNNIAHLPSPLFKFPWLSRPPHPSHLFLYISKNLNFVSADKINLKRVLFGNSRDPSR
jgi:hypothetical protein